MREQCQSETWALHWMFFTYSVFFVFFIKLYVDKARERRVAHAKRKTA